MFGAGGPLAAQSRVRSCPSLIFLVGGGEVVNVGVTTQKKKLFNRYMYILLLNERSVQGKYWLDRS